MRFIRTVSTTFAAAALLAQPVGGQTGATVIAQTRGTAPGLICPLTIDGVDKVVFAVPGVPHEMQDMFHRGIIPELQRRSGERFVIASRVLRTWGESESGLNERLDGLIAELDEVGNPTLAFLASGWNGLKVRLTAKASDTVEASKLIGTWERRLRDELGDVVFGVDDDTMESVVLDLMRARGWSLGCAESVTGGLVGARLTGISGASDVFRGSIVSYATEVKQQVLDVPEGPVVSEEAALAMAQGARRVLGCDVALALTGVAGPGEQDGMPAGTLCCGLVWPAGAATRSFRLPGLREQMRQFSVINSLDWLRRTLT
jgi:nicotinamide-nucleotide amidase